MAKTAVLLLTGYPTHRRTGVYPASHYRRPVQFPPIKPNSHRLSPRLLKEISQLASQTSLQTYLSTKFQQDPGFGEPLAGAVP